jgi:hypothetical protein
MRTAFFVGSAATRRSVPEKRPGKRRIRRPTAEETARLFKTLNAKSEPVAEAADGAVEQHAIPAVLVSPHTTPRREGDIARRYRAGVRGGEHANASGILALILLFLGCASIIVAIQSEPAEQVIRVGR